MRFYGRVRLHLVQERTYEVQRRAQAGSNLIGIAKDVLDSYFALSTDTSSADHENTLLQ